MGNILKLLSAVKSLNLDGKKKYSSWVIAMVFIAVNHFGLGNPSPNLDEFVAALVLWYQSCETVVDSFRAFKSEAVSKSTPSALEGAQPPAA